MKPDSGMPAFENIDEILSDKIINHGRDHADCSATRSPSEELYRQAVPATNNGPSKKTVVVAIVILSMIILILYRLLNRQQNR